MKEYIYSEIKLKFEGKVNFNVRASDFTSYRTGGNISVVFYPSDKNDVVEIFEFIRSYNLNYFICGNATNILVSDDGFDGIFIKTDRMNRFDFKDNLLNAECGLLLDNIISQAVERSLEGLEKLSYIPGSIGGGIRMNAGAFGCEIFDSLEYFDCLNLNTLNFERKYKKDLKYSYRYVENIENYFILNGFFVLKKSDRDMLFEIRDDIIKKRISKQPLEYPSAGSVFKRPPGGYASKLIDECGLKGFKIGGAMVSPKHAGFIINVSNATSQDIYSLINFVKDEVYRKTGVNLELEQILVGRF